MYSKIRIISAMCLWLMGTAPVFAGVVVVVNPSNPASNITVSKIKQIYMGGSNLFVPLEQDEHSTIRTEFYKKVMEKSPAQVEAIWAKLVFTARGSAPKVYKTSTSLKKAISDNVNAMGYMEKSEIDETVKVIAEFH
ncbi:MAG: hypothetical protein ACJ8HJ_07070 [Massilia sp.]